ncbi:MAG: hypothetical protein JW797_12990 [Bradymonadales bacterium]|nr:hypothetical protein [Bradymonadales bacterium]
MRQEVASGWLVVVAIALLSGCAGSGQQRAAPQISVVRGTTDGLLVVTSDLDGNGVPEIVKYFQPIEDAGATTSTRRLVRTEIDLNGDGRADNWRHYDPYGELVREEMDGDLDGRVDYRVYWENGLMVRSEQDRDHDGRFDVIGYYQDGFLLQVERDLGGGRGIDSWSYYDGRGLTRIGYDTDEDGEPDVWIQRPSE